MKPTQDQIPPPVAVMQMLAGRWVSQAVSVAAELGVADHLEQKPRSVADVAKACKANPDSLYRLMRALASVGVFHEESERQFVNTPLSATLRTDAPGSLRGVAKFWGMPAALNAWAALSHSVKTAESAFEHVHGMKGFDWMEKHPEDGAIFNDAMTSFSMQETDAVNKAFDFSNVATLCDVGGGHGMMLASVLAKNPRQKGVLFDLAPVVKGAPTLLTQQKVADRVEVKGGDFFKEAPPGCDGYMLKHIIHDWDDAHCKQVLDHIHKVAKPGARLFVIDAVIPPGNAPSFGKLLDLEMLVITHGGRERSESEFKTLLKSSGWELKRVVETQSPACVIEAVRV